MLMVSRKIELQDVHSGEEEPRWISRADWSVVDMPGPHLIHAQVPFFEACRQVRQSTPTVPLQLHAARGSNARGTRTHVEVPVPQIARA